MSENLPHPCVHLVFAKDKSAVFGVVKGKFSYRLEGQGRIFGVAFRPGAFYPFVNMPVSRFTDATLSLQNVFGLDCQALEDNLLALTDESDMISLFEDFLRGRLPEPDDTIEVINRAIDRIITERDIRQVDDLVRRLGINKRTLQRIFSQYVGVSPKWVINRYRLHEAAEQLSQGATMVDWRKLALELGYFDQAHFIKDFKAIVGQTPADYAKNISQDNY